MYIDQARDRGPFLPARARRPPGSLLLGIT
jgi:hypothetical protein